MRLITYRIPHHEEIKIYPIGDIQYGSPACDWKGFKDYFRDISSRKNSYFIGMGDYIDAFSPSNRENLRSQLYTGKLYDTLEVGLNAAIETWSTELKKVLAPTVGRWLGLVPGHHFWDYPDGTNSDMRLANYLKTTYLGAGGAMVRVQFTATNEKHGNPAFTIYAHHGQGGGGGGKMVATPLNKMQHLISQYDADVILMGHTHRISAALFPYMSVQWGREYGKLIAKNRILANTGSWLKTHSDETGEDVPTVTYAEKGMMGPVPLGGLEITAKPQRDSSGLWTILLNVKQ